MPFYKLGSPRMGKEHLGLHNGCGRTLGAYKKTGKIEVCILGSTIAAAFEVNFIWYAMRHYTAFNQSMHHPIRQLSSSASVFEAVWFNPPFHLLSDYILWLGSYAKASWPWTFLEEVKSCCSFFCQVWLDTILCYFSTKVMVDSGKPWETNADTSFVHASGTYLLSGHLWKMYILMTLDKCHFSYHVLLALLSLLSADLRALLGTVSVHGD